MRHWATGTAAPCFSIFKPVAVDQPLNVGSPTDQFDSVSLWWRGEQVHRRLTGDAGEFLPRIAADREPLEREWFDSSPTSDEAFRAAAQFTDRWIDLAAQAEAERRDTRPRFVSSYWRKRNVRAGFDLRSPRLQHRLPVRTV